MHKYWNPVKIIIGRGSLEKLLNLLGNRTAVLVCTPGMVKRKVVLRIEELCGANLKCVIAEVEHNPTLTSIYRCFREVKSLDYDVVIALGGGSTIDTAKIIALLSSGALAEHWLENHMRDDEPKPEIMKAKPIIAIPSTAGSGSEVTPSATVWDYELGRKYSISDEGLYPEWALLDSGLTDSLPYEITLFTALDALSHSMEAIWNRNANPISDVLAANAIGISAPVLADSFVGNYALLEVRDKLQLASLLAGLALSNTMTALAHSISYPLTSQLGLPHGLAASFTLPQIMRMNYEQDRNRVGIIIKALSCYSLEEAVARLCEILADVGVPDYLRPFSENLFNLTIQDVSFIAKGRAENNISYASQADAIHILRSALTVLMVRSQP